MKTIKSKIETLINETQTDYKSTYDLFCKIREALKPFEGKTISKRMETAIKKALPGYTVYYSKDYSMYHLKVWKKSYNDMVSFLLGYVSEDTFYINEKAGETRGFNYFNICHDLDNPRAKALEVLKAKIPAMVEASAKYQAAKEEIETLCEYREIETFYRLQYLLKGEEK